MSSNNNNNNNNNKQSKVVKDLPAMRSVVIRSSSSLDYPLARTPLLERKLPSLTKSSYADASPKVESWTVLDHSLKELSNMYPLERTNATVHNATPQQVVDRIAECLRQQSVAATFDAEKAAVQAETREHVRFIVRLFLRNSQVIVEVQRRCGCSYAFHQCSDAVLYAAQGIQRSRPMPKKFTIPDCVRAAAAAAAAEQDEEEQSEQQAVEADLECALQLWKSDRYDAQLLGLESLILLSQQKNLAAFCAHSLLCTKCVQEMLLGLVSHDASEFDESDMMLIEHLTLMRRHAVTVLANCLEALGESGELLHVMEKNEALRSPELLDTLIGALSTAEGEPHMAHEAARCLGPLCRCSSLCKEHAMDIGATEAVTRALGVGMIRHALLEGASRRLQHEMGFS